MDQMSIAKLLLVTLPENLFSIYVAFLLTGDRLNLPFRDNIKNRKQNIIKLLLVVSMFSTIQFVGRRFIHDIATYFILSIFLSTTILNIIYRTSRFYNREKDFIYNIVSVINSFKKPFLQVFIMFGFLYSIEAIYIPPIMQTLQVQSIKELFTIQWVNILFPQFDRFLQLLVITVLWNSQRLNKNISQYSCKKSFSILPIIYIIVAEFIIIYLYVCSFNNLNIQVKIIIFIFITSMAPFNLFLYKIVLNVIDRIHLNYVKKGE